ncbi:helix-turn-helix transcriptional regulator [Staphylococcus nepalensis]
MKLYAKSYDLKKALLFKGYNLKEFSLLLGKSTSYITQIINGKACPSPKLAKSISLNLNKELEDLFSIKEKQTK